MKIGIKSTLVSQSSLIANTCMWDDEGCHKKKITWGVDKRNKDKGEKLLKMAESED